MHKLGKGILLAALVAGTATPAAADIIPLNDSAWYLGFSAGPNLVPEISGTIAGADAEMEFDLGYAASGEIGYAFGPSFRAGAEFGWRSNDIDTISGGTPDAGSLDVFSLMGTFTYDVPTGTALTPYVGGGVGGAWLDADSLGDKVSDRDIVFAYQGRAGLRYALTDHAAVDLGYRYFGTSEATFNDNGKEAEFDYGGHSLLLGVTLALGPQEPPARPRQTVAPPPEPEPEVAPPPMPEPAPAPQATMRAVPTSFLVFFDWNRSDIKPDGRAVVERAAAHYLDGGSSIVEVVGHADRSGTREYNMALSRRRAENVREVLIAEGVPAEDIVITARGEDDPLVPTPDGVREPRNRRVEIIIP